MKILKLHFYHFLLRQQAAALAQGSGGVWRVHRQWFAEGGGSRGSRCRQQGAGGGARGGDDGQGGDAALGGGRCTEEEARKG